jgi:hypothetical protein
MTPFVASFFEEFDWKIQSEKRESLTHGVSIHLFIKFRISCLPAGRCNQHSAFGYTNFLMDDINS